MKKAKVIAAVLTAVMLASMLAVPAAAEYEIKDINVPIGECIVDGIIEPGEWDAATAIVLDYNTMVETGTPTQNRADVPHDCYTSVKVKVKDGFLYFLEERGNPNLKFYHDDPRYSYESNGGILWFFVGGSSGAPHDLFYMAGTKSNPTVPAFCYRSDNDNDKRVIIQAVEGATVLTPGVGSVCEAKLKLSDLGLTMADFEGKEMTMFHITEQVWLDSYNDQAAKYLVDEGNTATLGFWEWAQPEDERQPGFLQTGVPTWADSGTYITVADTFDAGAYRAAQAAAAAAAATAAPVEAAPVAAAATPAVVPATTTAAPQTGDAGMIFAVLALLASASVLVYKTRKRQNVK